MKQRNHSLHRKHSALVALLLFAMLFGSVAPALAQGTTPPGAGDAPSLLVTATTPTAGSTDVDPATTIVVSFNMPVVPLVGASEQSSLPQPLSFEPALAGSGEWISTSIYRYTPQQGLAGATEYVVTVEPLVAVNGASMEEAYSFLFSTTSPIVEGANPQGVSVRPDSAVTVRFSQPMDQPSTEAAFSLQRVRGQPPVEGTFTWDDLSTTLTFTPTEWLELGANYMIAVDIAAQPASGSGNLRAPFTQEFAVAALPAVVATTPTEGATNVPTDQQVTIRFASPMSNTLLMQNVTVSPLLTNTSVYSYYNEYDGNLVLEWSRSANTEYTITVGAAAGDNYGNTLGEDFVLTFTTGDLSSFAQLGLGEYNHFSPYNPSLVSVLYRNLASLQANLYTLPIDEFVTTFQGENSWLAWQDYHIPNPESNLLWTETYTTSETLNETFERVVWLQNEDGTPLAPGLYLLEVLDPDAEMPATPQGQTPTTPPTRDYAVIVISGTNLVLKKSVGSDSMAWMTDLATAQPIADKEVVFQNGDRVLATLQAGEDGTAQGVIQSEGDPNSWLPIVATVGVHGDEDFAITSSNWSDGINSYDFNVAGGYNLERYPSAFYTDRTIYQPGQTVYWRGIVREFLDDQLRLPDPSVPVTVTVRNQFGQALTSGVFNYGEYGTINGQTLLPPDSGTGHYFIEAQMPGPEYPFYLSGASFQVALYEVPEFNIAITPSQSEYTQGETISVTLQADYFSGGPLGNAPVAWRVIANPFVFTWDDAPEGAWYTFDPFDPENEIYDPYAGAFSSGLVKEGTGETDAGGTFTLELPADLGTSLVSQNWQIEFTVQSPTNQFVTQSATLPVHRANFYIGLSPTSWVGTAGAENSVNVVTVTPEGERYGGADVTMTVYEVRWNSVQVQAADGRFVWESEIVRTPVVSDTLRTNAQGEALYSWTPARGGQYQVVAQGEDEEGNPTSSGVYVWVESTSGDYVPWQQQNNDRIDLIPDQKEYKPGDTARILVANPFTGTVTALITIERSGVISHEVTTLAGGSRTIEVPIDEALIPNFFVSVFLVNGISKSNPAPAMRMGLTQVNVDTSDKVVNISTAYETASGNEVAKPGEVVTFTLTLTDANGEPAASVETSVAIVDKALSLLADGYVQPLLDVFYRARPLGVSTSATLVINRDRVSQQLSDGAKGGGGGDGMGGISVRENFPDTAFWAADLVSDEEGKIIFTLALPDNLTTWEVTSRGVDTETRVGETLGEIVVSKELQVRPALPRFFTAGDHAQIGAQVINTTDAAGTGTLSLSVEGATIDGDDSFELTLGAGASALLRTPVTILENTDVVTFTYVAELATDNGDLTDAVRILVPVERYQSPETVATTGEVSSEGVTEQIIVPANATDDGELVLSIEPSLAAGTVQALEYLENYPYECIEQTVSRFLPNAVTLNALEELGIENPELAAALNYQVGIAEQKLISQQNADGGWGYWQGEVSNPFITAYALWGLYEVHQSDATLPAYMERAIDFLERNFVAVDNVTDAWELNQMAFMHFVLAEVGEADPGRMSTLYDVRERLQNYGTALLAMAMADVDPNDARVTTLMDDLRANANLSATGNWWIEDSVDWQTLNTDVRSTAIALEAFVRIAPEDSLIPPTVRWLMEARRANAGAWSNTQENAWAIMALTDWMAVSGELEGDYAWNATLNDETWGEGDVNSENLGERVLLTQQVADLVRDLPNVLEIARDNDSGALYYTAHMQYYLNALAINAADQGIVVDRVFSNADGNGNRTAANSGAVGDVISVTVTVIAPANLHQVRVDVPIPAGAEILDPNLNTMPQYDESGNPVWASSWDAWNPTWKDYRNEKVSLFETYLPAGTWIYTFQMRLTTPGEFRVLPAFAEMMYFTEVWGRSSGGLFTVTE